MEAVDIIIADGTIVTVDAARRIVTNGALAIKGGRIVAVGKARELSAQYIATRTIDARDRVVMPGLINGHAHLLGHARGLIPDTLATHDFAKCWLFPYWGTVDRDDEYWGALNVVAEQIKSGTTCFVDPGCRFLESTIQAVAETGVRCEIGSFLWDRPSPHLLENARRIPQVTTREALDITKSNLTNFRGLANGRMRVCATMEGVGACSDELMLGARELAERFDVRMILHKASSVEEVTAEIARTGSRPVEHMHRIGALGPSVYLLHALMVNEDEVRMLAETKTKVCHSPSAALKLAKGLSRHGKILDMMKAGVTVCLGCDGSNSSDYRDMVRAIYLAAVLHKDFTMDASALTAERAIEMATIDAAKAIGWDNEVGSLEVGKKADIILFDTNRPEWVPTYDVVRTLVYSATGDSVDTVLVDGRVLMEGRKLLTIDEAKVRHMVQGRREDFLKRANLVITPRWPVM